MNIIGVDPGLHGAMAGWIDGELFTYGFESDNKCISIGELDATLRRWTVYINTFKGRTTVVFEAISMNPKWSKQAVYQQGRNYGQAEAMILSNMARMFHGVDIHYVKPKVWQKVVQSNEATTKARSIENAIRLCGDKKLLFKNDRSRTPHDGIADALNMAEYGKIMYT